MVPIRVATQVSSESTPQCFHLHVYSYKFVLQRFRLNKAFFLYLGPLFFPGFFRPFQKNLVLHVYFAKFGLIGFWIGWTAVVSTLQMAVHWLFLTFALTLVVHQRFLRTLRSWLVVWHIRRMLRTHRQLLHTHMRPKKLGQGKIGGKTGTSHFRSTIHSCGLSYKDCLSKKLHVGWFLIRRGGLCPCMTTQNIECTKEEVEEHFTRESSQDRTTCILPVALRVAGTGKFDV